MNLTWATEAQLVAYWETLEGLPLAARLGKLRDALIDECDERMNDAIRDALDRQD